MYLYRLLIFIPLALALPRVHAAEALVISLQSITERVRSDNPDIVAAKFRIQEALGRMVQSGRLANPELEAAIQHDPRYRQRRMEIGFSQRFPVTGRLHLEKEVTLALYKASEAEVREVERQIVSRAREGVVEVLAIRQRRDLLTRQSALSKEFSGLLADMAAKGEASSLDAGLAKLETTSLTVEMRQLEASETAATGILKPLLGMLPDQPLVVTGTLPTPNLPAANPTHTGRPDFQVALHEVEAARKGVDLEQAKRYDDVEAGLFAAAERTEDVPEGYDKEGLIGLRFKLPLPLWNKNEGAIAEAQARQQRKEQEAGALVRTIHLQAAAARAEMAEWAKLLEELSSTLIPLAEEQAAAAEEAFRQGQGGEIQTLFRVREKRLQLSSARLDALRQFHLARVRYQAAIAQP
jgi:cobalt-zinc-cadmium efflux system outer membrane protein